MSDLTRLAEVLKDRIRGKVETDRALGPLTTYRVGGPAAILVEPASVDDLQELGGALRAAEDLEVPVLALGRGSNMVVSDEGFPGVVVRFGTAFGSIAEWTNADRLGGTPEQTNADRLGGPPEQANADRLGGTPEQTGETGLEAGGGAPLPTLANWAARRGLAGLEFLIAIPGSVGGAVRMNAGAHGREIKDALVTVRLFDVDRLQVETRDASTLGFRYRASDLTDRHFVLDARFELSSADPQEVRTKMETYRRHRAETQPGALQNAGSTFKNPPGDHAGRLVEAAGLKGFAVGGASVSQLHANFFMASEGATSQDVYDLIHEVRARVLEHSGIELQPEVRFVGNFKSRSRERGGTVR